MATASEFATEPADGRLAAQAETAAQSNTTPHPTNHLDNAAQHGYADAE
ncbi:hypothetical protein NSU_pLA2027 (plasmid) [Novosphingobium pentaromativorans US6-1]|uniref:Uncharacterized protein n=1 Tax=Novosphingobium pentaromativorans US6-1 TaxID=1088721 RepID=G6ELF3_9SPHN|nr:hypothetical protein NSU_pLA2027 [Novosphingobium pentaromativorans US6-1]